MHIKIHIFTHRCILTQTHKHAQMHCTHWQIYTCTCSHIPHTLICTHTQTGTWMCTDIRMQAQVHNACTYTTQEWTHIHRNIHSHTYAHIHTGNSLSNAHNHTSSHGHTCMHIQHMHSHCTNRKMLKLLSLTSRLFSNYIPLRFQTCLISSCNHISKFITVNLLILLSVSCSSAFSLAITNGVYHFSSYLVITLDESGQSSPCLPTHGLWILDSSSYSVAVQILLMLWSIAEL